MRLAIFTDTYLPEINGVVNVLINLTEGLVKRGYNIKIFAPKYNSEDVKSNLAIERIFSIPLPSYKEVRIAIPSFNTHLNSIREFNPDIIHVHTTSTIGIIGLLYGKKYHKPIIGTYHTVFPEFTTYVKLSTLFGFDKFLTKLTKKKYLDFEKYFEFSERIIKKDNLIIKKLVTHILKEFYNKCDIVTIATHACKELLIKNGLRIPLVAVPFGIDISRFHQKKNYQTNSYKILHVGRVSYEKNIDVLIRAMQYVVKGNKLATLTIVGDGPAMDYCKILANHLNLNNNIDFKGMVNPQSIHKVYEDYDVFCTASSIETLGLVLLEAMAVGLPIVGVDELAIPEIVKHGESGFIVKLDEQREMADYILQLLSDGMLRERFGKKAVEIVNAYDVMNAVANYDKLYNKVLREI